MKLDLSDPAGMFMQEKLDGCFCRWSGSAFLSRNGHRFQPPPWWHHGMPEVALDGELWMGRGTFDTLVGVIQKKRSEWENVHYMVFDMPIMRTPVEARHAALGRLLLPPHCELVPTRICGSWGGLDATEHKIVSGGGEGVVLRSSGSCYRPHGFTKVKRLHRDLNRSMLD